MPKTNPEMANSASSASTIPHSPPPRLMAGGKPVDLRPEMTYQSPYLNGAFGDDRITVTVGPIRQIYDFGKSTVTFE